MNVETQEVQGVPVEIEEVRETSEVDKKTMYSRWHLLVNSNVAADDERDLERINHIAAVLKDSIRCVFHEHAAEVFFSKVPGDKFEKPTVESVNIKMAAEIGEQQKRVHVHVIIDVVHHTILQIDVKKMREDLHACISERDPSLPYPFMRLKWIPVNQAIEKYIGKAPVGLQ